MRSNQQKKKPAENVATEVALTHTVNAEAPLFDYLLGAVPDLTRTRLKSLIAHKAIVVNGKPALRHDQPLRPGFHIELMRRSDNPLRGNRYVSVVYEDPWLIVIDKQPGILSMQSDHHSFCIKTLLDQYFEKRHKRCRAHLVHRLDRDTSGLMLFAKSTDVQQTLTNRWHELITDRRYVAVVNGVVEQREGTIESWLTDDKFFYTHSSPTDNGGKHAVTHFETVTSTDRHSLLELKLETGRKNQIRVHMQDLGHPVVGDLKYGIEGDDPIGRLALHAFRLAFTHPVTGKPMHFETPYPALFTRLFP